MFKIGVVGAGHLGKIHLKILKNASFVNLIGFYDSDPLVRKNINSELGIKSFETYQELIENSDIIDIVTPTLSHYTCAKEALKQDKHVFIEKPVTHTLDEVRKLITSDKKISEIVLDPEKETADIDTRNNSWPRKKEGTDFDKFKSKIKG